MAFNELKYTQSVWHYQETKRTFWRKDGRCGFTLYLQAPDARCPACGSGNVRAHKHRDRTLAALPNGRCLVRLVVPVRKVVCRDCGTAAYERIPFAAHKGARITRALAKRILALASKMSMKAIAEEFGVSWRTVRDAVERGLRRRYHRIDLSGVSRLGIDEIHVFPTERSDRKYVTVVRDMDSRKVLDVARGKGVSALGHFARRIAPFRDSIKAVCMDMSGAYGLWAATSLPGADVVIDHFHVVKALTDRVNKARRKVMAAVDDATAKRIKGCRSLFLKNREDLSAKEARRLNSIVGMDVCAELAVTHLFKERMRGIYAKATDEATAAALLDEWIRDAAESGFPGLASAARSFTRHRDGILGWWRHGGLSNSSTEGFNRKIRGLLETAYGFHDYKFLRLRIFDLGERNTVID